jgi:hypothetical protein
MAAVHGHADLAAPPLGFLRLSLPALHRKHHFPTISEGTDQDQARGFGVFEPGFHIQAISPQIYDLEVIQPMLFPRLIFQLLLGLQTGHGGGREGNYVAQQPTEGQIKVAQREPMPGELQEEFAHLGVRR